MSSKYIYYNDDTNDTNDNNDDNNTIIDDDDNNNIQFVGNNTISDSIVVPQKKITINSSYLMNKKLDDTFLTKLNNNEVAIHLNDSVLQKLYNAYFKCEGAHAGETTTTICNTLYDNQVRNKYTIYIYYNALEKNIVGNGIKIEIVQFINTLNPIKFYYIGPNFNEIGINNSPVEFKTFNEVKTKFFDDFKQFNNKENKTYDELRKQIPLLFSNKKSRKFHKTNRKHIKINKKSKKISKKSKKIGKKSKKNKSI